MDPTELLAKVNKTFIFDLPGNATFEPSYIQAGLIVFLLFLLVLTLAQLRRRYVHWHAKGIMPGVAFGFMLAIILEGILIIGGRTILTETLGWKDAPKPISTALDTGRERLVDVLGVTEEVPTSEASDRATIGGIMEDYSKLTESESESLQSLICTPE